MVKTKIIFRNAIHTPDMAFTLISISRLDKAGFAVTFNKGICSINSPTGKTIATIPHSDGLYKIVAGKWLSKSKTANATAGKISISEAHRKLSCYEIFFFYMCLSCVCLVFFISLLHALTSRQTCLLHMFFTSCFTCVHLKANTFLYLFKQVVRQLYSLAFC